MTIVSLILPDKLGLPPRGEGTWFGSIPLLWRGGPTGRGGFIYPFGQREESGSEFTLQRAFFLPNLKVEL
jgi:hypothetical protein